MAFGKGKESTDSVEIKRYTGVGSVYVKGINPSKEELEKFFDTELQKDTEYLSETEIEGTKVPQVRLDFLVETDPEKNLDVNGNPIELKTRVTFFLRRAPRVSRAMKKQIIDKYGRTAWATAEEIANKQIPVYSNGKPANIDADYRIAYWGEEELTNFLIAYLNIPSPQKYVNGEWTMVDAKDLPDSEARLDNIENFFKGDFSELKTIINLQPNNKVKVLFGVRTADDGRQYQAAYTREFLKNGVKDYNGIAKRLNEAKMAGAYSTTDFEVCALKEYVVNPTDFSQSTTGTTEQLPWD